MQITNQSNYSFGGEIKYSFEEAVTKVHDVLKEQGFGVLTEIDAKKVLKEKLGLDRHRYSYTCTCH
jgi:uncharacterized protein (DUF302 family)